MVDYVDRASCIDLQKHRDAWRRYAYGRGPRPFDFLDGGRSGETELEVLRRDNKGLRRLVANAILVARNGDCSDGVMVLALGNLESEAAALGVTVGATFYENDTACM